MRPFHFAVLFWGDHYREHYFLDCWLRSMLAPGNLPLLEVKDGHKIVVACPKEDWLELQQSIVVHAVRRHVSFQHIEIDYPSYGVDDNIRTGAILHQHKWMSVLLKETHDPAAIGSVWSPDCIVSMRLVERMLSWVGFYDVAICPVLRQAEEPLLAELEATVFPPGMDKRWLTPRHAAGLSIRHLHREMEPFIEPASRRLTHAPYRLWRMPGEGMLLHGFFGLPIFMDYRVVSSDYRDGNIDTCLRTGNFAACERLHVVADSDEVAVLSLTPKDFKNYQEFPDEAFGLYDYLSNVRTAWQFFGEDHIRRQMWRTPVRWHEFPLTPQWHEREAAIERGLALAIGSSPLHTLAFDLPKWMKNRVVPIAERVIRGPADERNRPPVRDRA